MVEKNYIAQQVYNNLWYDIIFWQCWQMLKERNRNITLYCNNVYTVENIFQFLKTAADNQLIFYCVRGT